MCRDIRAGSTGGCLLLERGGATAGRWTGGAIVRGGCRWARCRFGGVGVRGWWGSRLCCGERGVSWGVLGGRGRDGGGWEEMIWEGGKGGESVPVE